MAIAARHGSDTPSEVAVIEFCPWILQLVVEPVAHEAQASKPCSFRGVSRKKKQKAQPLVCSVREW